MNSSFMYSNRTINFDVITNKTLKDWPPDNNLETDHVWSSNTSSTVSSNNTTTDSNTMMAYDPANFYQLDYTKLYLLSVIILLTILGNFSVVFSILMRRTKVTRMYFFILHLSIADILTAFFTLLPEFAWTLTFPQFYGGNAMCKIVKIFQSIGPYLSSYTLVMTAVDRFQAICYPLSNHRWTIHKSHTMLGIAWTISLLFSAPQAGVYYVQEEYYCIPDFAPKWGSKAYVVWFATSNFFVPFVVLIFCYTKMCMVLWSNFKQKKQQQQAQTSSQPPTQHHDQNGQNERTKLNKRFSKLPQLRFSFRRSDVLLDDSSCDVEAIDGIIAPIGKATTLVVTPLAGTMPLVVAAPPKLTQNLKRSPFLSRLRKESGSEPNAEPKQQNSLLKTEVKVEKEDSSDEKNHSQPQNSSNRTDVECPRSHSIRSISNAKIKTVKLTIVVVVGYLVCSAPYVCVQLYAVFGTPSSSVLKSMTWLFCMLTLNSCLNPWIYMAFNPELIHILFGRRSRNCNRASLFRRPGNGLSRLRRTTSGITTRHSDCGGRLADDLKPNLAHHRHSLRPTITGNPADTIPLTPVTCNRKLSFQDAALRKAQNNQLNI